MGLQQCEAFGWLEKIDVAFNNNVVVDTYQILELDGEISFVGVENGKAFWLLSC